MAIIQIPVRSDLYQYEFSCELDGTVYIFDIHYNSRKDRWIFGIKTSDGTEIVMGIPILVNYDLLGRFADSNLPPGTLFAINTESEHENAGELDLGDKVLLLYEEAT